MQHALARWQRGASLPVVVVLGALSARAPHLLPLPYRHRQARDPWPILDHASEVYRGVTTLSADFVQVIANPMIGAPDTSRGKLYQQRPSRFAMRFTRPKGDRIVADGRQLWLYTPSTTPGQVLRSRIPQSGTTGPNLIGQFVEEPHKRYTARYLRSDSTAEGATDVIALTPRVSTPAYREAVISVGRPDGLVRRLELTEGSGQHRTVILTHLVLNRDVPEREFAFRPPSGTRVVESDSL